MNLWPLILRTPCFTVPSHHRGQADDYGEKSKQSHRSRSPNRIPREKPEQSDPRRIGEGANCDEGSPCSPVIYAEVDSCDIVAFALGVNK